jgi:anti-sigma factor RsiW
MPDQLSAEHLTLADLADLAVDELSPAAATAAEVHLAECASCRAAYGVLRADQVTISGELGALGDGIPPTMPVTVAARLDRVLAVAADAGPATVSPPRRLAPLKAPATATYVKQTGVVRMMLAAAVAAAVVGFGGYFLSAAAGLNEPSALSPTQVHPAALADQAKTLAESRDLDAHVFSAAWRCARQVTSGRITGITPVYLDGDQHYLVYTRAGGTTYATLVTGCDDGTPIAGGRVELPQ